MMNKSVIGNNKLSKIEEKVNKVKGVKEKVSSNNMFMGKKLESSTFLVGFSKLLDENASYCSPDNQHLKFQNFMKMKDI
eukprot:CAMPEP_0170541742 /NCGR_PEP_ID=MMETSP0211-20121228/1393_1 /TAXON_ID=311385 /ORGANISM="Pseudokeronopsis sp., Strain OXSARD2" /LENGTH=78 /DNA_ID=CAMNT_0010844591 /DNA_START=1631 /DNA_END=1867 /DNA_ORIENTATION=-